MCLFSLFFFFKQKTAYEMRISDWSSDVCSSDLARSDAQRLAHRIDVDAGACALGIFALQQMGDAAGEFDDFQAALDVALRVGQHLAMFGGEQQGQFVHILFDQLLEAEHDAGAALGVGRGRSEEHTSELQSLMRISYAVFCLKNKNIHHN